MEQESQKRWAWLNWLRRPKAQLLLMWVVGVGLLGSNLHPVIYCGKPCGCVDMYWARFWLAGYSDGIVRRALLGQLVRYSSGDSIHYLLLNLAALLVATLWVSCVAVSYWRHHGHKLPWLCVLAFVGPLTTLAFETLGDPLQVALLLAAAYHASVHLLGVWRTPVAVMVGVVAVAVHEASAFLIVPFLYATHRASSRAPIRLTTVVLLVAVTAGGILYLGSGQELHGRGTAVILPSGGLAFAEPEPLPSLSHLFNEEIRARFLSPLAMLRTVSHVPRVLLWPLAAVVALGVLLRDTALPRAALTLFLPSLPLYVIAHDWGRFSIYTVALALLLAGRAAPSSLPFLGVDAVAWAPKAGRRAALAACAVMLASRTNEIYRVGGLQSSDFVPAFLVGVFVLLGLSLTPGAFAEPTSTSDGG